MSNIINYIDYINRRRPKNSETGLAISSNQTEGEATGESTRDASGSTVMLPGAMLAGAKISQSRYSLFHRNDSDMLRMITDSEQVVSRVEREYLKFQLKALSQEEKELLNDLLTILDMKFDEFLNTLKGLNKTLGYFLRELQLNLKALRIPSPKQESHLNAMLDNNLLDKEFLKIREAKLEAKALQDKQRSYPTPYSTKLKPRGFDKE